MAKALYQLKHKYHLDLQTGFIKASTEVIETDDRYKNRFIPWTAPIPPGGRVDLAAWQKQMSQSAGQSAADIALHEEFMKFKAERNTAAAGAPLPVGEPSGTTTAAIKPETLPAAPDSSVAGSQAGNQNQEGGAAPVVLTAGQRFDKIMSVMFGLTEADMTKSANPMPTVSALNRLTGLDDIEGAERESVFEAFVKANPEWEPKAE